MLCQDRGIAWRNARRPQDLTWRPSTASSAYESRYRFPGATARARERQTGHPLPEIERAVRRSRAEPEKRPVDYGWLMRLPFLSTPALASDVPVRQRRSCRASASWFRPQYENRGAHSGQQSAPRAARAADLR